MLTEVFYLHEKGSLADARLCTYILDDSDSIAIEKRPMMLICPGGGYEHTSDREAEPLAMHFLSIGYHVAVLRYSVAPAVYPTALLEAAASMKLRPWRELPLTTPDSVYVMRFRTHWVARFTCRTGG